MSDSALVVTELGLGKEAAQERAEEESDESKQKFRCPTISYEEAMKRELEYQKKMKLMQHSVGSRLLPTPQEPSRNTHPVEVLNGTIVPSQSQPMPRTFQPSQELPARQVQPPHRGSCAQVPDRSAPSPRLQLDQPVLWCHDCNLQFMNYFNLEQHLQGKKHRATLKELSGESTKKIQWCSVCNIRCMDESSLVQHRAGKRHRATLEELSGKSTKQIQWCSVCNICMDESSLVQHRAGKKHAACLQAVEASSRLKRRHVAGAAPGLRGQESSNGCGHC